MRDRVARVRGRLPDEIDEPIVSKVEADAQPIIYLAFSSDRHSPLEVTDFADRFVKDRLQNLPGVADVRIFGERRYAMRIWLDRARLAAYRLTPQDVEDALRRQNVEIPAGRIESAGARVHRGHRDRPAHARAVRAASCCARRTATRCGSATSAGPSSGPRTSASTCASTAAAPSRSAWSSRRPPTRSTSPRRCAPSCRRSSRTCPKACSTELAYDSSIFIRESIDAVFATIGEAVVLVVLVIFFFLRSLRATLIPLVTIPVCLIGAFALMYAFGFSINTLTLLAMVLAIGLVVDDAIVMLENIYRHVEEGMAPFQAALDGRRARSASPCSR